MGQTDSTRIYVQEGAYTFPSVILAYVLQDVDRFVNSPNTWVTITRTSNYISKVEYFSDAAKTLKIFEHQYGRTSNRITSITAIYYNVNGSEDSRVTHTLTRNGSQQITDSANPFSTSESEKI